MLCFLLFAVPACGDSISGTYKNTGGRTKYECIVIKSNGEVSIIVNSSVTLNATHVMEGEKLVINFQGMKYKFSRVDQCIEGMMGKYCK
jgi:hypothetical protein